MKTSPYPFRTIFIVLFTLLSWHDNLIMAQQPHQLTQYMFNRLVINPAYAGAEEFLSITAINRWQWVGVEGAPGTSTFSAHSKLGHSRVGLGLIILNDRIGVQRNTTVLSTYAYHLPITKNSFLSAGLQGGINSIRSDYQSLVTGSTTDPDLINLKANYINLGFGIYFRNPSWQIGLSAPEFLPSRYSVNDTLSINFRKTNLLGFVSHLFKLSKNWEIEPSVLVKYYPILPATYDININFIYRKVLTFGSSYRKTRSLSLMFKSQLTHQLQFGYSYDYPLEARSILFSDTHEVMLNYIFRFYKKKVMSPR